MDTDQAERSEESLIRWMISQVEPYWVSYSLMFGVLAIVIVSIQSAEWIPDNSPLIRPLIYGFLLGLLLAGSRFKGWMATGYSLFMSVVFMAQTLGRVVPPPSTFLSQTFYDAMTGMQIRSWALWARVSSWVELYHSGQSIKDTGLFILIVGLLVWNFAVWMAWWMNRRNNALVAVLPLSIMVAVNVHLKNLGLSSLGLLIIITAILIARTTYRRLEKDWIQRNVDYPYGQPEWIVSVVLISIALYGMMMVAPIVATPEGWRKISDLLQESRKKTADTAQKLFPDVKPAEVGAPAVTAYTPNLQVIGQPIEDSQDIVMYVTIDDPAPPPPQVRAEDYRSIPKHYWRNAVLAIYNGRGWDPPDAGTPMAAPIGDQPPSKEPTGRYLLKQHFEIVAAHTRDLFSVSAPVQSSPDTQILPVQPDTNAPFGYSDTLVKGSASQYDVNSWATRITGAALKYADTAYPADVRATYLQVPVTLPDRVRSLADRVTQGARSPYEKAIRIQQYLRETYPYDLDVPPPSIGKDAVDYFLFEAQRGFCSYYASAMAVMLRIEGVPARVATGYAMGEYDTSRHAYVVTLSGSHAWVEVYFPGYGWIEFEPTPARTIFDYPEGDASLQPVTPEAPEPSAPIRLDQGFLVFGAILLTGLLAFFLPRIVIWLWKEYQMRRSHDRSELLYWRMRRALGQTGMVTAPNTTPEEFLTHYSGVLGSRPNLDRAVHTVTKLYMQTLYSPRPPSSVEFHSAQTAWKQAFPDWLKLWIQSGLGKHKSETI